MVAALSTTAFDRLLAAVGEPDGTRLWVDLSDTHFVTPGGILFLTMLLEERIDAGAAPELIVPDDGVRSYLSRVGFFTYFEGRIDVEPTLSLGRVLRDEARRGSNPMLIELTKLAGMKGIPDLLESLYDVLRVQLRYKKNDANDLCIVTSEICQNIFQHNGHGVYGLVAMQVYQASGSPFVELAIGDTGRGINQSLAANPEIGVHDRDVDAIIRALAPGVSQFQDQTHGNGLDLLMDLVFRHEGSVTVRSGRGKVRVRMDRKTGYPRVVPQLTGTQVIVSLPTKEVKGGDRS